MENLAPRPLRALVADDQPDIVRLIKLALEYEGVSVCTCLDGAEALKRLSEERFDVLILDITMPVKDGIEVLREVRLNPETEDVMVIMLTGRTREEDVMQGYHFGADIYLTKPVSLGELQTIVRSIQ